MPPWLGALSRALEDVLRAAESARIYGTDHAVFAERLSAAGASWADVDASCFPVRVVVGMDALVVGDMPLRGGPALKVFADALCAADLAALDWLRPPTSSEVQGLVGALVSTLSDARGGCAAFNGVGDTFARAVPISAAAVRFRALSDDEQRAVGAEWNALCAALAGGGDASAESGPPDSEARRREALIAGMSPRLRQVIAQVGAGCGSARGTPAGSALSTEDLAKALSMFGSGGSQPLGVTVLMLQRLVGQAALDQVLQQQLDAGARATSDPEKDRSIAAATELMRKRDDHEFSPDDYRATLADVAASAKVEAPRLAGCADFESGPTATRECEIALWLLGREPSEGTTNTGAVTALTAHVGHLSTAGRIDLLQEALRAAVQAAGAGDERTVTAARALRAAIEDGATVARLLSSASDADIGRVLAMAPRAVLAWVMQRIASGAISPSHPHVRYCAMLAPADDVRDAVEGALQSGSHGGAIELLRHIDAAHLCRAAEPALRAQGDARAPVFEVLDQRLTEWPPALLHAVLADTSPVVHAVASRRVARNPGACCDKVLASLVHDYGEGGHTDVGMADVAIKELLRRGDAGVSLLADCLGSLSHGVSQHRKHVCDRLAAILKPHAHVPAVQDALKRRKRSLGFAVLRLMYDNDREKAA